MAYLLDANVFISATRQWYGFDFCPGFWDWLDLEHERGNVRSIERVRTEIDIGAGQLVEWARERPGFFEPTSTEVLAHLRILSAWASSGYYEQSAVTEFLQSADYYLIAHAKADSHVVVTHEVPSPETTGVTDNLNGDANVVFDVSGSLTGSFEPNLRSASGGIQRRSIAGQRDRRELNVLWKSNQRVARAHRYRLLPLVTV